MKNLLAYEEEQEETLKLIYNAKRSKVKLKDSDDEYDVKELIKNKYDAITERYNDYDRLKNQLEDINDSTLSDLEKKAMINCYEKSTGSLSSLKKRIRLKQPKELQSICAYCGINYPGTFDHYIPKTPYPEFSVYGPNLIPCCGECNSKKNDDWISDKNKKRIFLNFYYDSIPNFQIIESIITIEDDVPKIQFQFIKNNSDYEYKKLINSFTTENHYIKLNLLSRFKESCNSYIKEKINSLKAHKQFDEESIKEFLNDEYVGLVETYGANYWKSVTIKGMIDSIDFITYCSK